jgi:hypothetical protein
MSIDNTIFNLPYRSNLAPKNPYRYLTASLDLAGAINGDTLYFNLDNNVDYLTNRDYARYIILTQESIIDEVIAWADPVVVAQTTPNGPLFNIGGAETLSSAVAVPYAAPIGFGPKIPPQFSGAPVNLASLNAKSINYFGHAAAKFPYGKTNALVVDPRTNLNYLAITVTNPDLPAQTPIVESGMVHVQLRVFPK